MAQLTPRLATSSETRSVPGRQVPWALALLAPITGTGTARRPASARMVTPFLLLLDIVVPSRSRPAGCRSAVMRRTGRPRKFPWDW